MSGERRPIGYWLKQLDVLIEKTFERTLAEEGTTRREWQVLNTLAEGPSSAADLEQAVDPFLAEDPQSFRHAIADLETRAWVGPTDDNLLRLTPAGEAAHVRLRARVGGTRRLLVRGISKEEYVQTVDVLRRMAENLEVVEG